MNNIWYLNRLPKDAKYILSLFLISMAIGITVGLAYVYLTTNATPPGTVERFKGSEVLADEIPKEFPKPIKNMVLTTHDHVLTFAMITLLISSIFYFNSVIDGLPRLILLIEPFISTIIMFSSLWLMRYYSDIFVYLMMIAGVFTYLCWYIMIFVSIYDLMWKNND